MRRLAIVFGFAACAILGGMSLPARAADLSAPWISPQAVILALGPHPIAMVGTVRTYSETGADGPWEPGRIWQYASRAAFLADLQAGLIPMGSTVMLDVEGWDRTPLSEQAAPYRTQRLFVANCRAAGLTSIIAPADKWRLRSAHLGADMFLAQVQGLRPAVYRATLHSLRLRLSPGTKLVAELSTGRTDTVDEMYAQWFAGRPFADSFALWQGGGDSKEEQNARATAFLNRIGAA